VSTLHSASQIATLLNVSLGGASRSSQPDAARPREYQHTSLFSIFALVHARDLYQEEGRSLSGRLSLHGAQPAADNVLHFQKGKMGSSYNAKIACETTPPAIAKRDKILNCFYELLHLTKSIILVNKGHMNAL
jgi:hypothetical protein